MGLAGRWCHLWSICLFVFSLSFLIELTVFPIWMVTRFSLNLSHSNEQRNEILGKIVKARNEVWWYEFTMISHLKAYTHSANSGFWLKISKKEKKKKNTDVVESVLFWLVGTCYKMDLIFNFTIGNYVSTYFEKNLQLFFSKKLFLPFSSIR